MMGMKAMIIAGVILVILLASAAYFGGWVELGAIAPGTCQNIYAYYPSFRCCDETQTSQGTYSVSFGGFWQCPTWASKCEVRLGGYDIWYRGSQFCQKDWIGNFGCSDGTRIGIGSWYELEPGEYVYHGQIATQNVEYKVFDQRLCECSLSPCGTPCPSVPGSAGCEFVTNEDIYDANYNLKTDGVYKPGQGVAYTVPMDSCYIYYPQTNRHIIGDTCEECDNLNDCVNRYPSRYNYGGRTYGAVCGSGQIQLYDCMPTGPTVCVEELQTQSGQLADCASYAQKTRCDLYLSLPVECCPGTSACGPQAFCDPDTYTCEDLAACNYDWDCGRVVQCDYTTLRLKTPKCVGGQCEFSEQVVQCCYDGNCAEGYFCDSDYQCKQKPSTLQPCPYECCQNEQYYLDRPCSGGESYCCPDHNCAAGPQYCSGGIPPGENYNWIFILILGGLGGLLGYIIGRGVGAAIGAFLGGLAGFVYYWFTTLAWWQQWLLGILGVAGGGILLYLLIFMGGGGLLIAILLLRKK